MIAALIICDPTSGQNPETRPGKGLAIIPGDFIEFSNTMYDGEKKKSLPSTIMVAMGKQGDNELVQIISVENEKVVSKSLVQFDLTKEKKKRGELLDSGKEDLEINGLKYNCTWEKRKDRGTTATFWSCLDMPFERLVRVQMESDSGQKMVSEVVLHGPRQQDSKMNEAFMDRLIKLTAQNE